MRKTRKRAVRALFPAWACALARLEDRLLLSGTSYATEVAPIPPPDAAASTNRDVATSSPASVPDGSSTGGDGIPPPPMGLGDVSPDPSEGMLLGPITIGTSATPPPSSPSPSAGISPISASTTPAGTFGPGDPSIDPSGGGLPLGPVTIGTPVGEAADPRTEAIEVPGRGPMVIYFYSYNPSSADGPDYSAMAADALAAAAPAVDGTEGESPDLADPPPVPQPTAPTKLSERLYRAPKADEADEADPDGPPAVEEEPAPAASPEVPTPEETAPAEAPTDPIAAGLRLSAPLVDVAGWDEALGRLVEGVDDLAAGLHELGSSPATLPWVVAAGLMLVASEAARRARPRPRLAAAFVDGSASVVDPADDPSDRPRALPLGSSVRRLVARGLSRWTTRR